MARGRKRFQGVLNVIRFNWHFYVVVALVLALLFAANRLFPAYAFYIFVLFSSAVFSITVSLLVSYYVYDLSNLYELDWLDDLKKSAGKEKIVNINAGFDETSALLSEKFPDAELIALDFYDPARHTETSIKRARKAYPPYPNTRQTAASKISLDDGAADKIFVIMSAHEIRNGDERTAFFKELRRVLKPGGQIVLTEHLRDAPNFLAYNVGALHFHSKRAWLENIRGANLKIAEEFKITPFVTTFVLEKNGNPS